MEEYLCCQGSFGKTCLCCPNQVKKCPHCCLCLEVCCCLGCSIKGENKNKERNSVPTSFYFLNRKYCLFYIL